MKNYKIKTSNNNTPWSEEDWENHRIIFNRLAQPRKQIILKKLQREKRPLKFFHNRLTLLSCPPQRYCTCNDDSDASIPQRVMTKDELIGMVERLAKPRTPPKLEKKKPEWKLSEGLRNYEASKNIMKISQPRIIREKYQAPEISLDDYRYIPPYISRHTLAYVASSRINMLSIPKKFSEIKLKQFRVSRRALRARSSNRIKRIALPKEIYYTCHCRPRIENIE